MSNHCSQTVLPTLPHLSFVPVRLKNLNPAERYPKPNWDTIYCTKKPFGGFTDSFLEILPALCPPRRSHAPSEQCATAEVGD